MGTDKLKVYGYEKRVYEHYVTDVVTFHDDDVANGSCNYRLTGR